MSTASTNTATYNNLVAAILRAADVPALDKCRAGIDAARRAGLYAGDALYLLTLATKKEQQLAQPQNTAA